MKKHHPPLPMKELGKVAITFLLTTLIMAAVIFSLATTIYSLIFTATIK